MRQKRKSNFKTKDITLTIDSIGAGGDGIGTFEGKQVYVPKTAPQDMITARIEKTTAEGHSARLLDIQTPSPQRIAPVCAHFSQCGGCELQHIELQAYRDWKISKVKTLLSRAQIRADKYEEPIFIAANSRRRTTLALLKTNENTLHFGYHEPRSHNIISIKSCTILDPALDKLIQALRPFLLRLAPVKKTLSVTLQSAGGLDLVLGGEWTQKGTFSLEQNEILAEMAHSLDIARISYREKDFSEPEILLSRTIIRKKFGSLEVSLPPATFLQASDEGEAALCRVVGEYAKGAQNVADLFSGCGTFAGLMLAQGANVHAIDSDKGAMESLSAIKHPKLTTERRNLFKDALGMRELAAYDAVILDPPRAGAKEQYSILGDTMIPRIISVSCNPATFARDAKIMEDGGFRLKSLTIIDQFIWSSHVELVGLFIPA